MTKFYRLNVDVTLLYTDY